MTGDPRLAAALERARTGRARRVAAAVVDLASGAGFRLAFLGAGVEERFEAGSLSKALTGMLLADAVERGEVDLAETVAAIVPDQAGTPFGSVSLAELCTHTSGLPRLPGGARTAARGLRFGLLGLDPYRGIGAAAVLAAAARQELRGCGTFQYSNLGGAVAGQLLARRAGTDYPTLLRERLCDPLGMNDTAVATRADHARPGRSASGRPRQPWILDGYAPAGGVLTTVADLARLCGALLDGSAPGVASLRPLDGTAGDPERPMGMFWLLDPAGPDQETESDQETRQDQGSAMVWHNGATGGYSAFLALWPEQRRAVAVLADQARAEDQQRIAFDLAARPLGREERPPA